ncbi:Electron transfer DM13 [Roseovarius litorisediminis]|uniref:Electron transfer DM13 n=2 Tax=Roseovarius litorisediminis TaxID=1312363 RepID=A0A1Y5SMX1_9RHOB|nr:Electron transfer DM13 [Roseovarius litorisediminis]
MTSRRQFIVSSVSVAALAIAGPALAGGEGRTGKFTGQSNHVTSGHAKLVRKNGKTFVELQSDFQFDGAPDPKVALGKNGFDSSTLMGKLLSNSGAQSYEVPTGVDVSGMNEVWIWCEQYNVPLGVAKLN